MLLQAAPIHEAASNWCACLGRALACTRLTRNVLARQGTCLGQGAERVGVSLKQDLSNDAAFPTLAPVREAVHPTAGAFLRGAAYSAV